MSRRSRRQKNNRVANPADLQRHSSQAPSRQVTTISARFQGPLPPPEMLARYNDVAPNGADRVIAMAETQVQHRQSLELAVITGNLENEKRGQIFAFILGLVAIVGGIGLIAFGKDTQGLVAIISTLTALAGVFAYGRWQQAQERQRKRAEAREAAAQPRLPLED